MVVVDNAPFQVDLLLGFDVFGNDLRLLDLKQHWAEVFALDVVKLIFKVGKALNPIQVFELEDSRLQHRLEVSVRQAVLLNVLGVVLELSEEVDDVGNDALFTLVEEA